MIYQPPTGARDLFPLDVAQKRWIEDRLESVFQSWGYHRIITSTVEHMSTLMAGGAIEQSEVIELHDGHGQRLGLRPELTASIARAAVTRINEVSYPQRLYYSANVFRRCATGSHGGQQEYFQAGVELLGVNGLMADAEVLLLLAGCVQALGLSDWHLILGEADLTQSLLAPFPLQLRSQVRVAIATLDRVTLESLDLTAELSRYALQIMDLRGDPLTVLSQVSQFDLSESQRQRVAHLKDLLVLLTQLTEGEAQEPNIVLDLSLIQTFDYYTGIVFKAVSGSTREIISQGGRYDNLLETYHPQGKGYPGIGFVLHIETLQQVLLPKGQLPEQTPASDWLIVPTVAAAAAAALSYAQRVRQAQDHVRVELNLDLQKTPDELRSLARQRRIHTLVWLAEDGSAQVEALA